MTPFQQFRVWNRRAPQDQRLAAGIAALIAAALIAWLVWPVQQHTATSATTLSAGDTGGARPVQSGLTPGPTVPGAAPAPTATGSGGSVAPSSGAPAPAGAAGPTGCNHPGSDQGITASQIKIAVPLVNLVGAAGNATFGVPDTSEQQQDFDLVIAAVNAAGGVACRKIVPQYFPVNPAEQSDQQQKCLDILDAKPFAVVDPGAYATPAAAKDCFPVQGPLPYFGGGITTKEKEQFFPYLFSTGGIIDVRYHNTVHGLAQLGFFDPARGFKKLGFIYNSCAPELPKEFTSDLHGVGINDAQLVTYDVGCPANFSTPATLQQAILKFQQAGVTHITAANFGTDFANFTKQAQAQGFKPKWGFADDGEVATSKGTLSPDYDNIDGAIAIADTSRGQENTNLPPLPGTAKCNQIFKAAGRPAVYDQKVAFGGAVCNLTWMFAAAADKATSLRRASLVDGLHAAGSVDFSYPGGPNDFRGARTTSGGQFWRPLLFAKSCTCWKPLDSNFHPSFP